MRELFIPCSRLHPNGHPGKRFYKEKQKWIIRCRIYAGRQMVYHTAWCRDQKQRVTQQAAMVKVYCTEMVNRVADAALQIHGGMGYRKESPMERIYRDMRLFRIFEGTSEVQRMVIAREFLKD